MTAGGGPGKGKVGGRGAGGPVGRGFVRRLRMPRRLRILRMLRGLRILRRLRGLRILRMLRELRILRIHWGLGSPSGQRRRGIR